MKIPFYKDLILAKKNYTTLYGLSLLVGSGVPMEQSLALSVSADREQIAYTLHNLSNYYKEAYARVVGSVGPTLQMIAAIFLVLSGGILFGYTMLPMLQVASQGI